MSHRTKGQNVRELCADTALELDRARGNPTVDFTTLSADALRLQVEDIMRAGDLPSNAKKRSSDSIIPNREGSEIACRIYHPAEATTIAAPVLLFFHGGGWSLGSINTHDSLCSELAIELGITTVSVDYRLAPEHPFPAAVNDATDALSWLAASPANIGHQVSGIIVAGDSAGGNLAAVCAQQNGELPVPIIGQFLLYPTLDAGASGGSVAEFADGFFLTGQMMAWFRSNYLTNDAAWRDDRASPLLASDFDHLPPAVIFVSGFDPLRDQGREYAAKLVRHGVNVYFREARGQIHGCLTMRNSIPSARNELRACIASLRALVAAHEDCIRVARKE